MRIRLDDGTVLGAETLGLTKMKMKIIIKTNNKTATKISEIPGGEDMLSS